jgi:hypothetical protein
MAKSALRQTVCIFDVFSKTNICILAETCRATRSGDLVGYFPNILSREELLSKVDFFKSDVAIVCCEIACEFDIEVFKPSNLEVSFRQSLWNSYANGFHDSVTIKVEGKDFKVCYSNNLI